MTVSSFIQLLSAQSNFRPLIY